MDSHPGPVRGKAPARTGQRATTKGAESGDRLMGIALCGVNARLGRRVRVLLGALGRLEPVRPERAGVSPNESMVLKAVATEAGR
jgi:hypothetical protein